MRKTPPPEPKSEGDRRLSIVYQPLKSLVPYARNAKKHGRPNIQKLKASLREYGWATPMIVAEMSMLAGHGRLLAALEMAEEGTSIPGNPDPWQGPTVDLSHLTTTQRRAYILTDNRLAVDEGFDDDLLRLELGDLKEAGFDLSITGFDLPEATALLLGKTDAGGDAGSGEEEPEPAAEGNYREQFGVIVICTGEEHQKLVFEKLRDMGLDARVVAT